MLIYRAGPLLLASLLLSACERAAPLLPEPVGEPFASIAAGGHTTCALTVSGRAFCWGRGTSGQLGNGGTESQPRPIPVATELRFVELAVGYYHSCGLVADGSAYCWGARGDAMGQLGTGSRSATSVRPVRVDTRQRFRQISAGQVHTCALTAEGTAYCWGGNIRGQLGDGTGRNRGAPVRVTGGHQFASLEAGALHTCGATTDGRALCWGDNFFGSVTGDPGTHTADSCPGTQDTRCTLTPHSLDTGVGFVAIGAGDALTCALTNTGGWWCWGGSAQESVPPLSVGSTLSAVAIAVGSGHACALTQNGSVLCRGGNSLGQLGTGSATLERSMEPLPVNGSHTFQSVASGIFHTCALAMDGAAYCWGGNREGQLGHGSPHSCITSHPCARSPQPVRIH